MIAGVMFLALADISAQQPAPSRPPQAATAPKAPRDSSEEIADRIVKSKKPVLVDFWAVWCGPCRLLNPIIKELEKEYAGRVLFIKVNVDQHVMLSRYFQVSAIPAVFVIKDKTVIHALPGLQPKEAYRGALNSALASPAAPDTGAPKRPAAAK